MCVYMCMCVCVRVWFSSCACWWHLTHFLLYATRMCLARWTPLCTAEMVQIEWRHSLQYVRDLSTINETVGSQVEAKQRSIPK